MGINPIIPVTDHLDKRCPWCGLALQKESLVVREDRFELKLECPTGHYQASSSAPLHETLDRIF